ncbi:CapA family protein [Cohnella faecalis]|uniref:CapA family protein n=1 Tax=Cohnella faecalis TaxID=2315694 RepID=UPI00361F4EF6
MRGPRKTYLLAMYLSVGLLTACSATSSPLSPSSSPSGKPAASPAPSGSVSAPPTASSSDDSKPEDVRPPEINTATLLAVGDVMVHSPQLPAYYDAKSNTYDMSPWFERVAPIFMQADWVIANLETPLAGADLKYTGFPRFNAPAELADALKGAGVQLVSTANNHSMDRGFTGIVRTLRNVRQAGLVPFGTSSSPEDAERLVIEERNGIKLGLLACTYGTNGIPVPEDKKYAVDLIDLPAIREHIHRLREAGADAVSVSLHFGTEYQRMPNEQQIAIAHDVVAAGADVVLGSHPHVVQPYDIIEVSAADSADGEPHRGVVIYSLGNFISNQSEEWQDVGLIFGIKLTKTTDANGESRTEWDAISLTPTKVHMQRVNKKKYYTILPMEQSIKAHNNPKLTAQDYTRMTKQLESLNKHLQSLVK